MNYEPLTINQRGVSLIEMVLVGAAVVILALLIANLPSSISSINRSRHLSLAREIAAHQIENLRKQGYVNLTDGTNPFSDSRLLSLPQGSASYEISDCPVSVCSLGEAGKQVKVVVSWKELGDDQKAELVSIVSEGGLGQ